MRFLLCLYFVFTISAQAYADMTDYCLQFKVYNYANHQLLSHTKCEITQVLEEVDHRSILSCQFQPGKAKQGIVTEADRIEFRNDGEMVYTEHFLNAQNKLGQFLFSGWDLPNIQDGAKIGVYYSVQTFLPNKQFFLHSPEQTFEVIMAAQYGACEQ